MVVDKQGIQDNETEETSDGQRLSDGMMERTAGT